MLDHINVKYFKFAVGSSIGKEGKNDISSRCIICGDSEKDKKQKRLHLYRKSSYDSDAIKCFNCEFTGNMYSFLKEVDTSLYEQYKREMRESNFNSLKSKHSERSENIEVDDLPTFNYSKKSKVKSFVFPKEFVKASEREKAISYLRGRELETEDIFFCDKGFKFQEKFLPLENCIIIPLWYKKEENLVYGFQGRSVSGKTFYTYIPDENSGYKVWNWFNIDKTKPTFIFESVFDAKSSGLPNDRIVAALGSDLNDDRISELQEAIFCLDNQFQDLTSKTKSLKLLKDGYRVFVWPHNEPEKDANGWKQINKDGNFAHTILSNIISGSKGILKLKLNK